MYGISLAMGGSIDEFRLGVNQMGWYRLRDYVHGMVMGSWLSDNSP